MYLKNIILENVGPISKLDIELPFNENGNPKPIIFVGENGTGKSIVLSFIVNVLIVARQAVYENTEVEKGKSYKYRSPLYIKSGEHFYYANLKFQEDLEYTEWQLNRTRQNFEKTFGYCPLYKSWEKIKEDSIGYLNIINLHEKSKEIKFLQNSNCYLYFPPNRFEEPAWLNETNLLARAEFRNDLNIEGFTKRSLIIHSILKDIQNWLLDILYDSHVLEIKKKQLMLNFQDLNQIKNTTVIEGYQGSSTNIFNEINKFLKILFQTKENIRFGVNKRFDRKIEIINNEKLSIPGLFNLSSGESVLFTMYCSILRDFDFIEQNFTSTSDVRGIVVIDEIDLHLHTDLQKNVLPELISLFPKVQFIVTTHSPLFLLGMRDKFGDDGFEIREMPGGNKINVERFKEFQKAYEVFKSTKKFEEDLKIEINKDSKKPILFVEGPTDKEILENAWNKLYPDKVMNFKIVNAFDCYFIGNTFARGEIFKNDPDRLFIGMLDFDEAFENWKRLLGQKNKLWIKENDETKGLLVKHKNNKGFVFLLPVPDNRKTYAGEKFGKYSTLSIELLFPDNKLTDKLDEIDYPGGGKGKKFKDSKKTDFAEDTKNLSLEDFENFKPIFNLIEEIINRQANLSE